MSSVVDRGAPAHLVDEHLRCDPDQQPAARWAGCADVLCGSLPLPRARAVSRARELLAAFPGCLVSAVPVADGVVPLADGAGWVLAVRGGPLLIARPVAGDGPVPDGSPVTAGSGGAAACHPAGARPAAKAGHPAEASHGGWLASLLHAWLATGRPAGWLSRAEVRLRCRRPCGGWQCRLAELTD